MLDYRFENQLIVIEKFNLGLLDLLSILLPGGFLAGLAWQSGWVSGWTIVQKIPEGWGSAATFAATAYILGHFIHLVASYLDDLVFDRLKKWRWPDQTLVNRIIELKEAEIGVFDPGHFNAFKWSLAYLLLHHPLLYQAVEKHIGESKFFRSFSVVLLIASTSAFLQGRKIEGFLALGLTLLSLVRYVGQRQKSIDSAYQYVITAKGKTKA